MVPDYLQVRNMKRHAQWAWRWHLQGGSRFWVARDLVDLRNVEDHLIWRKTEHKLRRLRKSKPKIVNLARWRLDRARRNRQATA